VIKPCVVVALSMVSSIAVAQPGMQPYPPQQPYAQPYAPYPGYGPPPVQLTPEENETLSIGYISDGQHLGGGLLSIFFGFGVGQAVEGRWGQTGWIFTLGEPVAFGVFIYGLGQSFSDCFGPATNCHNNSGDGALIAGAVALVGLRLWEVIDAWAAPPRHNARYRAVQMKLGNPMPIYGAKPYVVPTADGGAIAGISLRF
jgi:hypothetical protein